MARIFNSTYDDPDSLQIDIDDLIENYSATMRRILKHIGIESTHIGYYEIFGVRMCDFIPYFFIKIIISLFVRHIYSYFSCLDFNNYWCIATFVCSHLHILIFIY